MKVTPSAALVLTGGSHVRCKELAIAVEEIPVSRRVHPPALAALLVSVLAGCATTVVPKQLSDSERREQFLHYAGPPVDSVTYLQHYYAWRPLGNLQLVLWSSINDAYLLTVLPPCVGLDFADGINVTSSSSTITRGVDAVRFDHQYCYISQIRQVDYEAMKRAEKAIP